MEKYKMLCELILDYNRKMVAVTAVAKLTVIDLTAKVNPIGGGAD